MTGDSAAFRAQHEAIRAEFTAQAESWGRDAITSDLLWAVDLLGPLSHFEALDVAAGSGLLSRALASRVCTLGQVSFERLAEDEASRPIAALTREVTHG